MRWDNLLTETSVNHYITHLHKEYDNNQNLKNAINSVVHRFWSRRHGEEDNTYELFAQSGINYLIEELAVFGYLFQDKAVDLYAGQWITECISAIQTHDILSSYQNINYLEVDMVRNKSYNKVA